MYAASSAMIPAGASPLLVSIDCDPATISLSAPFCVLTTIDCLLSVGRPIFSWPLRRPAGDIIHVMYSFTLFKSSVVRFRPVA